MKRQVKTIHFISLLFALFMGRGILFAQDVYKETALISISDPKNIAYLENVHQVKGRLGKPSLELSDSAYGGNDKKDSPYGTVDKTDLLLHFDDMYDFGDMANYDYNRSRLVFNTSKKQFGAASGVFSGQSTGLILTAHKNALFSPGNVLGDFTIEFWLNLPDYSGGQNIMEWKGGAWLTSQLIPQLFSVRIENRHLIWNFSKVFLDHQATGSGGTVKALDFSLKNMGELIPNTWYHHMLRYDSKLGKLIYSVNDKPEDIHYASQSGKPENQMYYGFIGERSTGQIELGRGLKGLIDEVRIQKQWINKPKLSASTEAGHVIFSPFDFRLLGAGSKVIKIDSVLSTPGQTEIKFSYAMIQTLFPPADMNIANINWIPIGSNMKIDRDNNGLWFLLKADFYPDGTGVNKPSMQDVTISYTPDPPPPAPGGFKVVSTGNGEVSLAWNAVPVPDIQGYILYYGEKPGQYFGENEYKENSPLKLGNVTSFTLKGLDNYKVYYFMVASYDRSNDPSLGLDLRRGTSKEVSARPAP